MALASGSIDLKAEKAAHDDAATKATNYITTISSEGIQVHADDNTTSNYVQINADGMEIYKGGSSKAFYGDTARIGAEDSSHLLIEGNAIRGISSSGGHFFEVSDNGGSQTNISRTSLGTIYSNTATSVDLSTISEWSEISSGGTFYLSTEYYAKVDNVVKRYSYKTDTYTKGTTKTSNTYSSYTSPNTATSKTGYPSVPTGYTFHSKRFYLGKPETINMPLYRFGTDVAETGGANSFLMGTGTVASSANQLAIGTYNSNLANAIFMVGNGTSDSARSNIFEIADVSGDAYISIGGMTLADFVKSQGSSATSYGDGYWRWREWKSGKVEIWYAGSLTLNSTTSTSNGVTRREKWFNFPNSYSLNRCTVIVNGMNAGAWCGCGGVQNSSSVASDPRRKFEVMAYGISTAPAESQVVNIYICGEKSV